LTLPFKYETKYVVGRKKMTMSVYISFISAEIKLQQKESSSMKSDIFNMGVLAAGLFLAESVRRIAEEQRNQITTVY